MIFVDLTFFGLMNENIWWWCVYDMEKNEIQIDSSNNYPNCWNSGKAARKKAEQVARKYIETEKSA